MIISVKNTALKSFVGRLESLKDSYCVKLQSMAALDGAEYFYLDVDIEENHLSSFAQDAKFGYGHDFKIERVNNQSKQASPSFEKNLFVELDAKSNVEKQMLDIRVKFSEVGVNYRALEFKKSENDSDKIRIYVNNPMDKDVIIKLMGDS